MMNLTSVLSFFGGIGLFLYGMSIMSTGLKNAAGDKLKTILEKVTGKRVTAILTLIVLLLPAVTDWIRSLSPGDIGRQIANTHTIFAIFAVRIFEEEDASLLPEAEAKEQAIDDMQEQFIQNHIDRLMVSACDPLGGVIFADMCTDLERCGDQAMNIAEALVKE